MTSGSHHEPVSILLHPHGPRDKMTSYNDAASLAGLAAKTFAAEGGSHGLAHNAMARFGCSQHGHGK